jgi:predicted aminopeptidase
LAAYDDWVPAFEALFDRNPGDWRAFYAAAHRLAALPSDERLQY